MTTTDTSLANNVYIYTDGSCLGNPGAGGWAAILLYKDIEREISGSAAQTTNNRMELTAAIEAINLLKRPSNIELSTDSRYLMDGITLWLPRWKLANWRGSSKQIIKNIDLWQALDKAIVPHNIKWHWVKGHSGHALNERADILSRNAATMAKQNILNIL